MEFADPNSSVTTFSMQDEDVEFEARYRDIHKITVNSGTADEYLAIAGQVITIAASDAPDMKMFDKCQAVKGNISLADVNSMVTTFTMPDEDVEIKDAYKDDFYASCKCGENISWRLQHNGWLRLSGSALCTVSVNMVGKSVRMILV